MTSKQSKQFDIFNDGLFRSVTVPLLVIFVVATTSLTAGMFVGWTVYELIMGNACYHDVLANSVPTGPNTYEFVGDPNISLSPLFIENQNQTEVMLDHVFILHGNCGMDTGRKWMIPEN